MFPSKHAPSGTPKTFGLIAPGYQIPSVAAPHPMDKSGASFTGADKCTKLKLMRSDVASIGDLYAVTPGALVCSLIDERQSIALVWIEGSVFYTIDGALLKSMRSILNVMQAHIGPPVRFVLKPATALGDQDRQSSFAGI